MSAAVSNFECECGHTVHPTPVEGEDGRFDAVCGNCGKEYKFLLQEGVTSPKPEAQPSRRAPKEE